MSPGWFPRRLPCAILAGGVAIALLGPLRAGAVVSGTPHDMARASGESSAGTCNYCHVPHKAQGVRLWPTKPRGPSVGWGTRPIAQLCYPCHDSTGGGFNASNTVNTAYSEFSHGYSVEAAPLAPDGTLPRMTDLHFGDTSNLDCTTCHDPHATTPPFLRRVAIDVLCKECHDRENAGKVGLKNRFGTEEAPYSLHPTDVPHEDIAGNGVTGLHPLPGILSVPTASGSWRLGAHLAGWQQDSGSLSCQTCHPVHGGSDYLLGFMPGPPASSLTPVENLGGRSSALCQSCHQGGDRGELVGILSDHPINSNDGIPVTEFPAGWPAGEKREVTCSSCHDTHGGNAGTSLVRGGGNIADGWCFSCHDVAALTPPYHHSCRENDDPEVFLSVITCGDCHGGGPGWTAHNGFAGFKVAPLPGSSALCESCHVPSNPLALDAVRYLEATGREIKFEGAVYPSLHGPVPGTASHVVDEADDDSVANCQIKTTPWEKTGALSRYGLTGEVICESCHAVLGNAGMLLGAEVPAQLTGGWKANLLVEPYEDNSTGTGIEQPDWLPGPTLSALCRGCHYSVIPTNPPGFVHNPAVHTAENYLYPLPQTPYGRLTTTLLTTPNDSRGEECPEVSTADQQESPSAMGPAPGAFSYPAPNVLDCDSCHRPHGAHDASEEETRKILLEYTAPGAHGTVPCLECHDTQSQCGYPDSQNGTP